MCNMAHMEIMISITSWAKIQGLFSWVYLYYPKEPGGCLILICPPLLILFFTFYFLFFILCHLVAVYLIPPYFLSILFLFYNIFFSFCWKILSSSYILSIIFLVLHMSHSLKIIFCLPAGLWTSISCWLHAFSYGHLLRQ